MQSTLRRSYASLPKEAAAARSASTPLAVRIRRARRKNPPKVSTLPGSDSLRSGMTPSDYSKFVRDKYRGFLPEHATEAEWVERTTRRRQRIRGLKQIGGLVTQTDKDGTIKRKKVTLTEAIGEKIYLPNVTIRLFRNPTKKGEPYNPYEATFRMPQSFTKTDLRSYLASVYGVATTYIRTDNYIAPVVRHRRLLHFHRAASYRTYKRAVVGLVDPFYPPDMVEDMSAEDRKKYLDGLDAAFNIQERKDTVKEYILSMFKKNSDDWKWEGPLTKKRGVILRRIAEQRAARERQVLRAKQEMLAARQSPPSESRATAEL